jgi:hypothetical protein
MPPFSIPCAQEHGGKHCHGEQRNCTYEKYVVWTCAVEIPNWAGYEDLFPRVVDGYDPPQKKEAEPPGSGKPVFRRSNRFCIHVSGLAGLKGSRICAILLRVSQQQTKNQG